MLHGKHLIRSKRPQQTLLGFMPGRAPIDLPSTSPVSSTVEWSVSQHILTVDIWGMYAVNLQQSKTKIILFLSYTSCSGQHF